MTIKPPTIKPLKITQNPSIPGCYQVTIVCPHCGRRHYHGIPQDGHGGHRAAHCGARGGYIIDTSTEETR